MYMYICVYIDICIFIPLGFDNSRHGKHEQAMSPGLTLSIGQPQGHQVHQAHPRTAPQEPYFLPERFF